MAKNANADRIKAETSQAERCSPFGLETARLMIQASEIMPPPNPLRELLRDLPRGVKITIETI